VSAEWLEDNLKKNQTKTDGSFQQFLAKHLNIEIGMNLRSDRWSGADFWEQQARPAFSLDDLIHRSEVITVGIDGGGLDDLLGLAVLGREKGADRWLLWVHAWAHPIAIERRKGEESRYQDFQADKDLTIIESLPGDVQEVADVVSRVHASGKLASVGLDPEKTHKIMLQALVDAGIDEKMCFGISQGWKLVGAISVAERKLAEGILIHAGQRMMAWCVGNARVEPRGNAVSITKQISGSAKIDPLMATFNAVSLMSLNPLSKGNIDDFLNSPVYL
jgi:phage terminase large subunit-like protein